MSNILDSKIGVRMFIDWELDESPHEVRKSINTFKSEMEDLSDSEVSSSIEIVDNRLVGVDFVIDSHSELLVLFTGIADSFNQAGIDVSKDNIILSSEPTRAQKLRPRVQSNLLIEDLDDGLDTFEGMKLIGEDITVSELEDIVNTLGWGVRGTIVRSMVSRGPLEEALTNTVRDALDDT